MAVYTQEYMPYEGPLRGDRWRFAILTRYSFLAVFDSRLLVTFFVLCFIPPLLACGILYANHNAKAFDSLSNTPWIGGVAGGLPINAAFFKLVCFPPAFLAFLLVTFLGRRLGSPGFAHNPPGRF